MDEPIVRVLVVAAVTIVVAGLALMTRRWQRPVHEPVDTTGADLPAGIVIFTSTDCTNCRKALDVVKATGAPVREITWELEPAVLESVGVTSVPLTLVVGPDGTVRTQIVGVPALRKLRRALT